MESPHGVSHMGYPTWAMKCLHGVSPWVSPWAIVCVFRGTAQLPHGPRRRRFFNGSLSVQWTGVRVSLLILSGAVHLSHFWRLISPI